MTGESVSRKRKKPSIRKRSTLLMALCLILGFGIVIGRIAYLQFGMGDRLKRSAVSQQFSSVTISAKRGTIYDTNGKILAQSASVWKVAIDPSEFTTDEQKNYTAQGLAKILGISEENVLKKINNTNSQYEVIKTQVESDIRDEILEFIENSPKDADGNLIVPSRGINFYDDYKRYYPYGSLASSVIGFTGSDDQGLTGLEFQYDDLLSGTPGRLVTAQNANGGSLPFEYKQNVDAQNGNSLVLTIDETIQSICEKYIKQAIEENMVYNRAGCIIMNPNTGAIYANATIGGFDLNDPFTLTDEFKQKLEETYEDRVNELSDELSDKEREEEAEKIRGEVENEVMYEMWRNKTVSDTYYPGSVFKMVTASMALEENLISSNSSFFCQGVFNVYDVDIHCHNTAGHGVQTFEQAIMNSCNPALIQIGQLIGESTFWKYYQAFGFSRKTGVDLPGEADDVFFSADGSMGPVDLAVASFGQNFSITPMQMITAVCAVANGGYMVEPHFVKEILDSDGNVVETTGASVKRQVISEEVSKRLCGILEQNAIDGGAKNAYIAGYRVAGKTGTSEKKNDSNGDGVDDYIASFCGFAPADDAQVVMLVFFDTPLGGSYYGAQVAAPVFANVMNEVLPYLEIERQYTEEELENVDIKTENFIGIDVQVAAAQAAAHGFGVTIKGDGITVIAQMPEAGSMIPSGGTIVLYTDEESRSDTVTVPNLCGYSLSIANQVAAAYGVNISLKGPYNDSECVSISQSIEEGTQVSPGTVITVTFANIGFND